ncbi:unnamed protein product, partial [Meganyctiphanes norvegica]
MKDTLTDVLNSLQYVNFNKTNFGNSPQNSKKIVMEAFNVTEEPEHKLKDSETEKLPPRLTISLEVLEADELNLKVYESTSVYCIIKALNKSTKTQSANCYYVHNKYNLPQWKHTIPSVTISANENLFATIEVWL